MTRTRWMVPVLAVLLIGSAAATGGSPGITNSDNAPRGNTGQGASAVTTRRPNVLWVSCEDISPDLGCYGDRYAVTPNLDRFATQAIRYTHAFTNAGVCAPSRAGIIFGCWPPSISAHHMRCKGVPPVGVKLFPEWLRAAGYYCTNNNKTDYQIGGSPTEGVYLSAWDDCSTKAHWRNRPDPNQPFFAVFNITTTHESQVWPTSEASSKKIAALPAEARHDPARAVLPPYYPDTPLIRADWARYHDLITVMDREFAAILKQLEDDGLAENTIVFFWSDHGRGLPRCKRWIYDSGIHVPLMVRYPNGQGAGTVSNRLVSLMDLGPTVLSLVGIKPPEHMHGRAFLGAHAGPERTWIYAHRDRMDETYDLIRCVRDRQYKYIRNFQPGKPYAQYIEYMEKGQTMKELRRLHKETLTATPEERNAKFPPAAQLWFAPIKPDEELYDCDADPHEVVNLAGRPEHAERLARMRAELDRWMTEVGDQGHIPEKELWEKLRPGGQWQSVAAPKVSVTIGNATDRIAVSCDTPGASLIYTLDEGDQPRWRLLREEHIPVVPNNKYRLRIRAVRAGFLDSPTVMVGPNAHVETLTPPTGKDTPKKKANKGSPGQPPTEKDQ